MWKNVVEPDRPPMTIWRMRIACWITKATDLHSEYVLLFVVPQRHWFRESASILRLYTYCLSLYVLGTSCFVHTAEVCVGSKATHCEVCGVQNGTVTGISMNIVGFTCQYHSTNVPASSSNQYFSYQKNKRVEQRSLQTKQCCVECHGALDRNVFYICASEC